MQEFGSLESAARYSKDGVPGGMLLEKSPAQRMEWYSQQPQAARERDLRWWNEDAVPRRITVAVGSALGALVFTAGLLVVAGGVIVSQAVLLFLLALAPLVFVLALWPGFGTVMLQRWGKSTLRAALGQVVSVALLAVMAGIVQVAGSLEARLGWEAVLFLLAGLAVSQALFWRAAMLRWVRRPALAPTPAMADVPQAVPRPSRARLLQGRSPADRQVSMPTREAATAGTVQSTDAGAEVVDALSHQMATNRARMLIDMEGGRSVQRPRGIIVESSTPSSHLRSRVSETVPQAASAHTAVRQSDIRRPTTIPLQTSRVTRI